VRRRVGPADPFLRSASAAGHSPHREMAKDKIGLSPVRIFAGFWRTSLAKEWPRVAEARWIAIFLSNLYRLCILVFLNE
jgi:hypothetical protein